jgi:hypothetical protein
MTRRLVLLATVLSFMALPVAAPGAEPEAPRLSLLVPAYFYPSGRGLDDWDRLIASAARAPIVAIANPASGPGAKVDPNYSSVIARAVKAGVTVIGYVSTSYAKRPIDAVKADIDRWARFYPEVRGIFLDEQASGADRVAYYAEAAEHAQARLRRPLIVTNPGTTCAEEFLARSAADVACLFEGGRDYDRFRPPPTGRPGTPPAGSPPCPTASPTPTGWPGSSPKRPSEGSAISTSPTRPA